LHEFEKVLHVFLLNGVLLARIVRAPHSILPFLTTSHPPPHLPLMSVMKVALEVRRPLILELNYELIINAKNN
jgi:hypothetical protein